MGDTQRQFWASRTHRRPTDLRDCHVSGLRQMDSKSSRSPVASQSMVQRRSMGVQASNPFLANQRISLARRPHCVRHEKGGREGSLLYSRLVRAGRKEIARRTLSSLKTFYDCWRIRCCNPISFRQSIFRCTRICSRFQSFVDGRRRKRSLPAETLPPPSKPTSLPLAEPFKVSLLCVPRRRTNFALHIQAKIIVYFDS